MEDSVKKVRSHQFAILIFFIVHFLFITLFGRFNLKFQEQVQLFRFDLGYLSDFIGKPGGLMDYIGSFLIQFYYIPLLGALILTIAGYLIFHLSTIIFRSYYKHVLLPGILPVVGLLLMLTDPFFTISFYCGIIVILCFVVIYITIKSNTVRYFSGFIFWGFLYHISGGFSFLALILFILHEIISSKDALRFPVILIWLLVAAFLPYLTWISVYQIPLTEVWISQNFLPANSYTRMGFIALLVFYPTALIISGILRMLPWKPELKPGFNKLSIVGILSLCVFIYFSIPGLKVIIANQKRVATIMKIDACIQQKNWEKGINVSARYKRTDPLVVFFTNLCLLKSGRMSERMFYHRQVGRNGIFLDWVEDNVTPFFGSEIFYQLGYTNETYRWAFEAFIATGPGSRMLKRLVISSILNNDHKVAEKYLGYLERSLFYHDWARKYSEFLKSAENDTVFSELNNHPKLLIKKDFFYDLDNFSINMQNLLENNPGNREIYEFTMALHLLEKDLPAFITDISKLNEYGYKEIPVHFEEALLVYIVNTNQDVVPEGFSVRESTIQRFRYYVNTNTTYMARPRAEAARVLSKDYGNTYWYYSQFY